MLPYLGIILPSGIPITDVGTYVDVAVKVLYEEYFKPALESAVTKVKEVFTVTIPNTLKEFFTWLGISIYNALIYVIDRILDTIEWGFNLIRPYLSYAIMITVAWFIATRTLEDPNIPFWKKFIYPILGIILGAVLGELFSALVPERISIPKISTVVKPIVTEAPISTKTLYGIYAESLISTKTLYSIYAESLIQTKTLYGVSEWSVSTMTLYATA